jgi:hypothetical protein
LDPTGSARSEAATTTVESRAHALDQALERLASAAAFAKPRHQEDLFALAGDLLDAPGGLEALAERAPQFDGAGVFTGGPWESPARLLPRLVKLGLLGQGVTPTLEALSNLRMLALAEGRVLEPAIAPDRAARYLTELLALHLTELRGEPGADAGTKLERRARRLFELLNRAVDSTSLIQRASEEIELLAAQRPIVTQPVEKLVAATLGYARRMGGQARPAGPAEEVLLRPLEPFRLACEESSPRLVPSADADAKGSVEAQLTAARAGTELLQTTGIAPRSLAVALRWIAERAPEHLAEALSLDESGTAQARQHAELVARLVLAAVHTETRYAIEGLRCTLERCLLAQREVRVGLEHLTQLDSCPQARAALGISANAADPNGSTRSILIAGSLAVLGSPLGMGQGDHPTCQSVRGISLWSQHAPGELLKHVAQAAHSGFLTLSFEGQVLRSDLMGEGLAKDPLDASLDPISRLLVPHLDRLYNYLMALATGRGQDGHRWVNPALYGRWIPSGFELAELDFPTPQGHGAFLRRFYATHHPRYRPQGELRFPNPVGILVTDVHGRLLGPHAVTIQRIPRSPGEAGEERVYFYNPNNEGRQDWGGGVRPTVRGHGERPGESSLPFAHFASRVYAFHYDPHEQGDPHAISEAVIADSARRAASSWMSSLTHRVTP